MTAWPEWQKDAIIHGGVIEGIGFIDRLRILVLGRFSFRTTIATAVEQERCEGSTTVTIPGLFDRWKKLEQAGVMSALEASADRDAASNDAEAGEPNWRQICAHCPHDYGTHRDGDGCGYFDDLCDCPGFAAHQATSETRKEMRDE